MFPFKKIILVAACAASSLCARAGQPVNGTTSFSNVSAGPKASGSANNATGITASNIEGFNFKLTTLSPAANMVIEVWDGVVSSGNGVAFYEETSVINPLFSAILITSNDGALFDLNSIGLNVQSTAGGNTTVTITGLDGSGNPIPGASTTGVGSVTSLTTFNVSANPAFRAIAGIRITSSDLVYAFVDNINLANVGTVLPLSWLNFSATAKNNAVLLNWSTIAEQGTTDFVVEHSLNGSNWTAIGSIAAAGNSSVTKTYTYSHLSPNSGSNYYRLSQQDIAGRKTFSNILYLNTRNNAAQLAIYPNIAVNGFVNVKLSKKTVVQVYNPSGAVVLVKTLPEGVSQLPLNTLPAGLYHLKAAGETGAFIIL